MAQVIGQWLAAFLLSFLRKERIAMKPLCQSLSLLMAVGFLLGSSAFQSAADEKKATEKTALTKSEKGMSRLIGQLGSERFQDREQATQELLKLGKAALPSLKEALKSSDAE